jgi:hypothetical protein
MASGAWVTQMLHVAAELGVADALAQGPLESEVLAERCGAEADALTRLLRGLASLGVFEQDREGRFQLTPLAELLRSDHPQSMRQFLRMLGEEHYLAWDGLLESVRSGEPAFRRRYGCSVFDHYQQNSRRGAIFDGAMTDVSRRETAAVLAACRFDDLRHVVDVGGGHGQLLKALLLHHPQLRGTLFDQPAVLASAELPVELEGRLTLVGGDFFEAVPEGADAYLLKHILHDWDDGRCLRILERIAAAMAPGGRVLILEQVIPEGNAPFPGKLLDLNMLVMTEGGRERTVTEYAALLESAGLRLETITPTADAISLVRAVAAPAG